MLINFVIEILKLAKYYVTSQNQQKGKANIAKAVLLHHIMYSRTIKYHMHFYKIMPLSP